MTDDRIRLRDIEIVVSDDELGVLVKGRGSNRFVTYDELVELAEREGAVTIR